MADKSQTQEMADSGDKRLRGEPDRKGATDNNAIRPDPQTTEIPPKERLLLDALSEIGQKTYSMGNVETMTGLAAADCANKAIEDWAKHGR